MIVLIPRSMQVCFIVYPFAIILICLYMAVEHFLACYKYMSTPSMCINITWSSWCRDVYTTFMCFFENLNRRRQINTMVRNRMAHHGTQSCTILDSIIAMYICIYLFS